MRSSTLIVAVLAGVLPLEEPASAAMSSKVSRVFAKTQGSTNKSRGT